jgi:hypothetical protein
MTATLISATEQVLNVAASVDHSDDLDAALSGTIEDQVIVLAGVPDQRI